MCCVVDNKMNCVEYSILYVKCLSTILLNRVEAVIALLSCAKDMHRVIQILSFHYILHSIDISADFYHLFAIPNLY